MGDVKAYLANQFLFSETGRYALDTLIKPRIREIGIAINDPFEACGKELHLDKLAKLTLYEDVRKFWAEFSDKISPINNSLMQDSDCFLGILDGSHSVDDGVASEIGYYAGIKRGPIFALRSDFRLAENISLGVNAQILGYIKSSNGAYVDGPNAIEKWFSTIKQWHDSPRAHSL
jgi:nucleoside 2-deoxyribosyltransferase